MIDAMWRLCPRRGPTGHGALQSAWGTRGHSGTRANRPPRFKRFSLLSLQLATGIGIGNGEARWGDSLGGGY